MKANTLTLTHGSGRSLVGDIMTNGRPLGKKNMAPSPGAVRGPGARY